MNSPVRIGKHALAGANSANDVVCQAAILESKRCLRIARAIGTGEANLRHARVVHYHVGECVDAGNSIIEIIQRIIVRLHDELSAMRAGLRIFLTEVRAAISAIRFLELHFGLDECPNQQAEGNCRDKTRGKQHERWILDTHQIMRREES